MTPIEAMVYVLLGNRKGGTAFSVFYGIVNLNRLGLPRQSYGLSEQM